MKIETEEKNIEILQLIIDKKTTIENVISHLQRNRLKLSSAQLSFNKETFSKVISII